MKSIVDEETANSHRSYDEFERWQFIVDLDIGDRIEIKIEHADGSDDIKKEFIAKYVNCHINCQWQDKGIMKVEEDK